jgi:hypothetical protein
MCASTGRRVRMDRSINGRHGLIKHQVVDDE